MWPGDAAAELSRGYRDLAQALPTTWARALIYLTAPPEPFVPADMVGKMACSWSTRSPGDAEDGAEHARPTGSLGPPWTW